MKIKIKHQEKVRKAQIQIQEMAFVLVGLFLLFAFAFLGFAAWQTSLMKQQATSLRLEKATVMINSLISMPELACSKQLGYCIDEDKLVLFKSYIDKYELLFKSARINYIAVKRIFPKIEDSVECNSDNYPNCNLHVLYNKQDEDTIIHSSFAVLCHYDMFTGNRCDIAEVLVGIKPET